MSTLQILKDRGFDQSKVIPFGGGWRVRCSQCEALTINGTPTHEHGCPNRPRHCAGCDARIEDGRYCDDCA